MGGGARAAYQAGALKALAELTREVDPDRRTIAFPVVCGTSAGAINAALLAAAMLANSDAQLASRLEQWRERQTGSVVEAPE